MTDRCRCRECLEGDALPEQLQGWPDAWQMMLFPSAPASLGTVRDGPATDGSDRDAEASVPLFDRL